MNILKSISEWFKNHKKHTVAKRQTLCQEHAKELIQVREFNGTVYFSYNDTPLLSINDFKGSIAETLDKAREVYTEYAMTKF